MKGWNLCCFKIAISVDFPVPRVSAIELTNAWVEQQWYPKLEF